MLRWAWEKIRARLQGKKSRLVFTGYAGVGKTVLYDHLRGAAPKMGYQPPGRSARLEKQQVTRSSQRLALHVVPGQDSAPRLESLDTLFTGKDPIDGVVHVVANGYAETRIEAAQETYRELGITTWQQWLDIQRKTELDELKEVARYVEQSHRKHHKPKWLLVALAKYDLYYDQREEAQRYYLTDTGSPFVQTMQETVNQIGAQGFTWNAAPVCTYLDRFSWPGGAVAPQLTEPERDHFLSSFLSELERLCEK